MSPRAAYPLLDHHFQRLMQRGVAVGAGVEVQRRDVAVQRHRALRCRGCGVSAKIGTWIRWRLIHSAVEPDSVSATIALQPRW